MFFVLVDTDSVSWKIINQNKYGVSYQVIYLVNEFGIIPTEVLKCKLNFVHYNNIDELKNLFAIDTFDTKYVLISNNEHIKNILGINICVGSYELFDEFIAKTVLNGLNDKSFITSVFRLLDYQTLKLLLRLDTVNSFKTLLSILLTERNYNVVLIAYLKSLIDRNFTDVYDSVRKEITYRRRQFKRLCNKYVEEVS